MDQHPVPQNVTSFEFHLVGDMTIKQFLYLAIGLAIAYLLFIFATPTVGIIAWPLIVFSSLSGIAFAFLPLGERPLDHWVNAFFKAIFSPTQRIWSSSNASASPALFQNRLQIYLNNLSNQTWGVSPALTNPKLSPLSQRAPGTQPIVKPPTPPQESEKKPLPSEQELEQTVELAKKGQGIQSQIVETEHQLNQIKASAATPGANPEKFAPDFQKILSKLQELTKEASEISREMAELSKSPQKEFIPKTVVSAVKRSAPINLSLTSTPNVINGIVTDSQNNYLEGAIVVTHDKQGLPVRALKSNKLGQFVAATPLPNGTYLLTLEKDNLVFDNIQIDLSGKVLPPIQISAKSGGTI